MADRLSPWQPMEAAKPAFKGVYQVQDSPMPCRCCWIDAHWDGREWHTRRGDGPFNVWLPTQHVRRWRGRMDRQSGVGNGKS